MQRQRGTVGTMLCSFARTEGGQTIHLGVRKHGSHHDRCPANCTKLTWGRWKGGTDHGPDCATRQEDEQLRRVAGRVVDEGVPTFGAGTPGEDDRLLTAVGDHGTMEQNSKTKKNWPSRGRWRKNRGFEPTRVEIQCSELNVQKSKFKHKIKIQSPVVKSQHRGLPASTVVRTKVHVHNQSWRRDLPLLFAQPRPTPAAQKASLMDDCLWFP